MSNNDPPAADIQPPTAGSLAWRPDDLHASLTAVLVYVETEATKAIDWYWANKGWKAFFSRWIRLGALVLTAIAGVLPVLWHIAHELKWIGEGTMVTSGLWASVLVGLAAALLGTDRAFGFSSGWARYVLAATEIRRRLEEFRLTWIELAAAATSPPQADQVAALLRAAKEFRLAVEGIVAKETQDWVAEFQGNLALLEKEVGVQLDALKLQADKTKEARVEAARPGSIEATIENADRARDFACSVSLDGPAGAVATDEPLAGSRHWVRLALPPGTYRLTVKAAAPADGRTVSAAMVVQVVAAEVARPTLKLPLA